VRAERRLRTRNPDRCGEVQIEEVSKRGDAAGPGPVDEIVAICRQVKRKLLKRREAARDT